MNLYEIKTEIEKLLYEANDDGVIQEDIFGKLSELQLTETQKIENVGCYIKNITSEIEALKKEEKELYDRRAVKQNKITSLTNYLSSYMENTGKERFESARVSLSFRKSTSVFIEDYKKIPDAYLKYKDPEVDKKGIKEILSTGGTVAGAYLKECHNLQIK